MTHKSEKSSAFRVVVVITLLLLAAAGGIAWMQSGSGRASGVRDTDSLAALARHSDALAAQRAAHAAVRDAAARLHEAVPALREAVAPLLQVAGANAAGMRLQERAAALADTVDRLLAGTADGSAADAIRADAGAMREVRDALAGNDSSLDIAPLAGARRAELLPPLSAALADIEAAAATAADNAGALAGADIDALLRAAQSLQSDLAAGAGRRGVLANPWLVPGLLAAALLAVLALALLHARSAVFERAAQVQSEQNERNQQAILRLLDELGSLADGDLTVEATVTEDITGAIADSINYAIEKLRELVATINETAIMVDSAAKQTKNTAVHMARAADNQGREIRAATESIDSMAASIEEVSGNAERSSDVARHSVDVAHKGGDAVRRTIDGMNTIRETIQETSKRIKRLGESSQEIGNIVELINDIAEQTNILALNASIQASMAGEAGRGFAVVADEVQRLAERSTNATKQIEVLVRTIQTDTNEAVISMERSTTDVVGGALLAENAGAALDEIEQVSNQIASLVQNISGSAREQAGSAADVTRRTAKLKEISEQTGKATTATAAAISKLSVLASQLRETVAGFTLPNSAIRPGALSNAPPQSPRKVEEKEAAG